MCVSVIVCSHASNIAISTPGWQKLKESISREQSLDDILEGGMVYFVKIEVDKLFY